MPEFIVQFVPDIKIHLLSLCPSLLYLHFINDKQFRFDLK